MIELGLTGSIGMGKSTTAALFAEAGAAVYDADRAVHILYAPGGAAGPALRPVFPDAVDAGGGVSRPTLARLLEADPSRLALLERLVHPLVAADRLRFLQTTRSAGARLAVLDIPLLFETGGADAFDAVVVVTAPPEVQRARVLARPGMDEARLAVLLARQTPDADKRARADFVIDTGRGLDAARAEAVSIVQTVLRPGWRPPRRPPSPRPPDPAPP